MKVTAAVAGQTLCTNDTENAAMRGKKTEREAQRESQRDRDTIRENERETHTVDICAAHNAVSCVAERASAGRLSNKVDALFCAAAAVVDRAVVDLLARHGTVTASAVASAHTQKSHKQRLQQTDKQINKTNKRKKPKTKKQEKKTTNTHVGQGPQVTLGPGWLVQVTSGEQPPLLVKQSLISD